MKKILLLMLLLSLCLVACTPATPSTVTYTVTVLDADGAPAAGVGVQLCKDESCLTPKKTDEHGRMTFTLAAGEDITAYHLTLSTLPEGNTAEAEYRFASGATTLEIQLKQ